MKKFSLLIVCICAVVFLCGFSFWPSKKPNKTATPESQASALTVESHVKKPVKTAKKGVKGLPARKNAVRQKVILNKMEKDLTIMKSPSNEPEPSPRDVHPSNQF
jgi:hypothetical protein